MEPYLEIVWYKSWFFDSFVAEYQHNLSLNYLFKYLNPDWLIIIATKVNNPTFMEAINGPGSVDFLEAIIKEYSTLS